MLSKQTVTSDGLQVVITPNDIAVDCLPMAMDTGLRKARSAAERLLDLIGGKMAEDFCPPAGFRENYQTFRLLVDPPSVPARTREFVENLEDIATAAIGVYEQEKEATDRIQERSRRDAAEQYVRDKLTPFLTKRIERVELNNLIADMGAEMTLVKSQSRGR